MHRRPPRSPRTYTLFPHTPRCRSSFAFKLPDGAQSVGTIRVTLFADRNAGGSGNAVREVADGRNAEGNNSAQATVVAGARTYPDLRVGDDDAPPPAAGGDTTTQSLRAGTAGHGGHPVSGRGTRGRFARHARLEQS